MKVNAVIQSFLIFVYAQTSIYADVHPTIKTQTKAHIFICAFANL